MPGSIFVHQCKLVLQLAKKRLFPYAFYSTGRISCLIDTKFCMNHGRYHAKLCAKFQLAQMFLEDSIAKLLSATRFANSHSTSEND